MLEAKIQGIMDRYHAVSVSVYAGKRGETIFQKAVGLKNPETGEKTDIDTIYRSASVSKHVSAMTAMTLVDKGLLDIDEDISTYLGYTVRNPWHKDVPITCRQLMTFSSTLHERGNYNAIMTGKLPPYKLSEILPEGAPGYTEANFAREIPGAKVDYSSFCIGILGTIVEKVTGMRFAEYARKAIEIGVDQYLTKPVTRRAMTKALDELSRKIEAEKEKEDSLHQYRMERHEYELFLQRRFFEDVFAGKLSVEMIYQEFEGVTWYMQKMLNQIFSNTADGEEAKEKDVEKARDQILGQNEEAYKDLLYLLTVKQRNLLIAI